MKTDKEHTKNSIKNIFTRFNLLKNYSYKFYVITVLGITAPILIILLVWLYVEIDRNQAQYLILLAAILVFISIAITTFIQKNLLRPLFLTESSLDEFIVNRKMSNLPTNLDDEVGRLMRKVQYSVKSIDEMHKERKDMHDLISIDMRDKITAVYNYSEMITEADTDEKKSNLKFKIASVSLAQIELIDSIKGILEMEEILITKSMKKEIEIEKMINSIKERYADEIHRKKLSIEMIGDLKLVKGKEALLKQAFTNLISNAIKYSDTGGKIVIDSAKKGKKTYVKVIDNGVGFTSDKKDLIFERFTRARRRGTAGEPTNGLGLYLSRKIIDKHSGTIEAKSLGEGKGAEFIVSLPD